ncbi:MAG: HNH endonuclease [Candidatus Dormibacteraeota bacterium]|nr:HNH endonuclease [Candidatus Dormibacteraeota bacterium]
MRSAVVQQSGGISPELYVQPPFSAIEQGLFLIDEDGPDHLSPKALRADLQWFAKIRNELEAVSARWLAALDRREQQASPDPFGSCTQWLHDALHLTSNGAYAQVRTARQLSRMPATAGAFRRGEVTFQQVAVICRAVEEAPKTCLGAAETESELLAAARRMDPQELHSQWWRLRYEADQAAGVEAEAELHRRRWLRLRQTWTGSYRLDGELDAEGGTTLKTALQGLLKPPAADDQRSPDQRRADALVELAGHRLAAGDLPERGGDRPHLSVVAQLSALRLEPGSSLAELDWGALVTGETARRIGCDAWITPVLVGPTGDILHVGRRCRSTPTRLRQAANVRDRTCQSPGCLVPAQYCQPHHVRHWADGGRTDLDNLRLYCDHHHRLLHPENDRHRRQPGGGNGVPGPDVTATTASCTIAA